MRSCERAAADRTALRRVHDALGSAYEFELTVPDASECQRGDSLTIRQLASIIEHTVLRDAERRIVAMHSDALYQLGNANAKDYVAALVRFINAHRAAHHAYFDWFEHCATRNAIAFWLAQESTLDPNFVDALALIQLGCGAATKMEIAKNCWDEMGNGHEAGVHATLFERLTNELGVTPKYMRENVLLGARVTGNLSSYYAIHRRNHYRALGFFGVTQYLVPRRFKYVVKGLQRNQLSAEAQAYHRLHIMIDAKHGAGWFNNAIRPVVLQQPAAAIEIAIGACIRLHTSAEQLDELLQVSEAASQAVRLAQ